MMNGPGKSDSAIVAERPTNKAGRPAEELEERRAETEGNAVQQSTRRAQNRESVSQALDRIRQAARQRKKKSSPRSSTTLARNTSRRRSTSSRRMPHPEWMGKRGEPTRKAVISLSWTYTRAFIKSH